MNDYTFARYLREQFKVDIDELSEREQNRARSQHYAGWLHWMRLESERFKAIEYEKARAQAAGEAALWMVEGSGKNDVREVEE